MQSIKFISVYPTLSFSYCPSHPKHPEEKNSVCVTGRSVKDRHELTKDEKALRRKYRTRVRRPVDSRTTFNLFLFSLLGLIVATSLFSRFLKFRQIIVSHLRCVDKCGPWLLCVLWSLPCTVHGMVSPWVNWQPEYSWSNQHWQITEPNLILNDVLCWRIFFFWSGNLWCLRGTALIFCQKSGGELHNQLSPHLYIDLELFLLTDIKKKCFSSIEFISFVYC